MEDRAHNFSIIQFHESSSEFVSSPSIWAVDTSDGHTCKAARIAVSDLERVEDVRVPSRERKKTSRCC